MRIRHFLALALVLVLPACAGDTDGKGAVTETPGQQAEDGLGYDPLDGTQIERDEFGQQGARPGTQQDLVVNVGDRVFFGYDRHDLTTDARQTLQKQALWLKKYPHLNVTIEGHADERGTREYNLALGDRRATSVKNYLVALGVDSSRLSTISYGKERPAVPESTPAAWAQNRRAVTVVQ